MALTLPGDARLALSLVVNVEEGSEMTVARGDRGPEPVDELGVTLKRPIRNYGNESNYLYGIKVGASRVFGLLAVVGVLNAAIAAAYYLEGQYESFKALYELAGGKPDEFVAQTKPPR